MVYLLLADVESIALIASVKLLLHEFCGAQAFFGLVSMKLGIGFGYVSFLVRISFDAYCVVLLTMKGSIFGMLQHIFLTVSFFILNSLTWFHFIPRMLHITVCQHTWLHTFTQNTRVPYFWS
jgi:hypothetical protein